MTRREVVVLRQAAEDLQAGRRFYDEIEYGVGDYFFDSMLAAIESLRVYAGIHEHHCGRFRLLSRAFPFGIYYHIRGDLVVVVAVLDLRRHPAWIRAQLRRV